MPGKAESIRYYVITSPLDNQGLIRHGRLSEATRVAVEVSRHARGLQLQIWEMPAGRLVKIVQDGREFVSIQTTLIDDHMEMDQNFAASLGKLWWRHLGQQAQQIAILRSKLSLTDGQLKALKAMQNELDSYLQALEVRLHPQSYALCMWKHVEQAVNKNRGSELPNELRHYDPSSINRRLRNGYIDTGYTAYDQGWTLVNETSPRVSS
ncbi:hypothetical protein [Alicyclobacillus macrosporangiidus]|uniref:Uncharacterized protein n=1 Tax=Alicyclobacillus macrosporangiidus TaxID=392015 RepID=A0A1I7KDY4_9BACL|nr:hypothetical protein [Alicyclobacillus macrosporangiidus]SFU95619.1 hypothetical protein SAMN05421543_11562 [Alicyclobacillus macrosporangiidus]